MASITFLFAAAALLSLTHALSYDCADLKKNIGFTSLTKAFEDCAFQDQKLESTCVLESCPKLSTSNLCPFDAEGEANDDVFEEALTLVTECLSASTSICGVPTVAFDIQGTSTDWGFIKSSGNFTFGPGSQLTMPWQLDDFLIAFGIGDRESFDLEITYTFSYQTVLDQGFYTYKPKDQGEVFSTTFTSFPVTFTTKGMSVMLVEDLDNAPDIKVNTPFEGQKEVEAGQLTNSEWPADKANDANKQFMEVLRIMINDYQDEFSFGTFVTKYAWYILMEMDRTCERKQA